MNEFLSNADSTMTNSRAYTHPLLQRFRSSEPSKRGMKRFAVQWYLAATAHKKSFPGLVYNVRNDEVRLGLIDILNEEYGYGELEQVHARILQRFLHALDINTEDAEKSTPVDGIEYFSRNVDEAWVNSNEDFAYGVHYALEYLAANMHKAFYAGVSQLGLPGESIEYFKIHSVAEVEHAEKARKGLELLSKNPDAKKELSEGIAYGTHLVEKLLDGLDIAYSPERH